MRFKYDKLHYIMISLADRRCWKSGRLFKTRIFPYLPMRLLKLNYAYDITSIPQARFFPLSTPFIFLFLLQTLMKGFHNKFPKHWNLLNQRTYSLSRCSDISYFNNSNFLIKWAIKSRSLFHPHFRSWSFSFLFILPFSSTSANFSNQLNPWFLSFLLPLSILTKLQILSFTCTFKQFLSFFSIVVIFLHKSELLDEFFKTIYIDITKIKDVIKYEINILKQNEILTLFFGVVLYLL